MSRKNIYVYSLINHLLVYDNYADFRSNKWTGFHNLYFCIHWSPWMRVYLACLDRFMQHFNNNYFSQGNWWYHKLWDENRLLLRPFCTWYQNIKKYHYWIDIDDNELNISIMHEFLFDKKALTLCTRMPRTI